MKKLLCFIGLFLALFALKSHAGIPGGTIPFIFDSHLYLQVRLNDTIPSLLSTIQAPTFYTSMKII